LPKPESRGRRQALFAGLGIAISVGLLFWALRGVNLSEVIAQLRRAHPAPLLAAVIIATLTFPLRLIRWLLLLRDEQGRRYPVTPLWHAIALGFTANNVLPLRAGELVRTYAAARLAPARFSTVLSSVAVERIFDALTVVTLLTLALLSPDLPSKLTVGGQSVSHLARGAALAGVVGLFLAFLVVIAPLSAERLIRRLLPFDRVANALVDLIEGMRQGLLVLRTPARLLWVIFWSLVIWLFNALGFYLAFAAFDIPVSYLGALLLQGLLVLGISLPSTPGFFGPFEAVIVAVLALYGVPKDVAFSYAIAYHLTSFIPITLLGLWSLARNPGAFSLPRRAAASA
jgi:glycosyltransferase 2 family protein